MTNVSSHFQCPVCYVLFPMKECKKWFVFTNIYFVILNGNGKWTAFI